jgi:hypothetical protein
MWRITGGRRQRRSHTPELAQTIALTSAFRHGRSKLPTESLPGIAAHPISRMLSASATAHQVARAPLE